MPFRGRRVVSLLVGTIIALYFGVGLVLAGIFFDDLVREMAPSADPLLMAAKGLLPFGLGYAALRVGSLSLRGLTALYEWNRYAMMRGFRAWRE